jgi:hypothetical protein
MCSNIYYKGLVAEVSKFLFGEGFAVGGGEQWRARRRAVGPSLHRWADAGTWRLCTCVLSGAGTWVGSEAGRPLPRAGVVIVA